MGTNSSRWDRDAHYAAKTTRQLEEMLTWWRDPKRSSGEIAQREIAFIQLLIAERIVGKRTRNRQVQYQVKWAGYPDDRNTWEPKTTLVEDVPGLVQQYEALQRAR